ncbi:MAG: gliding motility-associated C-terminal domain-containing protein [Microscillaceae bacterium]|nr:gliding motility-associated C-terminal domain-containing protein [Microscillaceae bacterium]MDW8460298.1 gliding motility-associated C-terminal domain-containing protein [Cytophagales bacterium]
MSKQYIVCGWVGSFFSCLFALISVAQRPCFEADVRRGCVPLTIKITECTNGGINLLYKYGDGNNLPTPSTTHTYNNPGVYSITQIGSFNGQGDSLRKVNYIEVLPTPAPHFEVFTCADRQVFLNVIDKQYESYQIDWGDGVKQTIARNAPPVNHIYNTTDNYTITVKGVYIPGGCGAENARIVTPINSLPSPQILRITTQTKDESVGAISLSFQALQGFDYEVRYRKSGVASFQTFSILKNVEGTQTVVIPNLDTQKEFYCLQIDIVDKCNNRLSSEEFCTINLNVEARDSENLLSWNRYLINSHFQSYLISRNGQVCEIVNDWNTTSWIDRDVLCKQQYCYAVVVQTQSLLNQARITSNTECVQVFSTLQAPAVSQLNATIQSEKSVALFWKSEPLPRILRYTIVRNERDTLIIQGNDNQALDNDIDTHKQPFCYQVSYENECGNRSELASKTCTAFLQIALNTATEAFLQWSPYQNFNDQFEGYFVQKFDAQNNLLAEVWNGNFNFWVDDALQNSPQIIRYRVKVKIRENVFSYSNFVQLEQKNRLFVPNAFSPNNDGVNDTFEPQGLHIHKFTMKIYNRIGEKLYETQDIRKGWSGQINGTDAPQGTYIYVIEFEDFLGNQQQQRGTFLLLR